MRTLGLLPLKAKIGACQAPDFGIAQLQHGFWRELFPNENKLAHGLAGCFPLRGTDDLRRVPEADALPHAWLAPPG